MPPVKSLKGRFPIEAAALCNAIHRCHTTSHKAFHNYGARGITVCDEWRGVDGFKNFIEHIGAKPHPALTLDRLDNERGYEPGNVAWRTRTAQALNRRPSHTGETVTIRGETRTYRHWAQDNAVAAATIRARRKRGWAEDRLLAPAAPRKPFKWAKNRGQ